MKTTQYGVNAVGQAESTAVYDYDDHDLPKQITDSQAGTQSFGYDVYDRLSSVTGATGKVSYGYDAADRRSTMTTAGTSTSYGWDKSSILTSVTSGSQQVTLGLDTVGRAKTASLPGGTTRTTGYDATGVIKSIAYAQGTKAIGDLTYPTRWWTGQFRHDHGDRGRLGPRQIPHTQRGRHDEDLPDRRPRQRGRPRQHLRHRRHHLRLRPEWHPHRLRHHLDHPYTFTGREDDHTGLLYYRERYYDPQTGRFISQDLSGQAGGANLYQYALASPTTYTDPSGNNPMIAACVVGGLMDGGLDWLSQRLSGRKVNWGQVGQSAAIGCLSGMLGEGFGAMLKGRLGSKLGSCALPNSFTGDTPVLMADGTRKPIKDVAIGDTVIATDPETGDSGPRKVTALIKGAGDKQLVDLTLDTDGPTGTKPGSITATDGHPFWAPTPPMGRRRRPQSGTVAADQQRHLGPDHRDPTPHPAGLGLQPHCRRTAHLLCARRHDVSSGAQLRWRLQMGSPERLHRRTCPRQSLAPQPGCTGNRAASGHRRGRSMARLCQARCRSLESPQE